MTNIEPSQENDDEKIVKEYIQKRFKSMFSGDGKPLSNMSIQEVEALKARVAELEAGLAQQSAVFKSAPRATSEIESPPPFTSTSQSSPDQTVEAHQSIWKKFRSNILKKRASGPLQGRRLFGLRSKLVLAITLTALPAVVALSYFASVRGLETQIYLGNKLQTTVTEQTEGDLVDVISVETRDANGFLQKVTYDVGSSASYLAQLFNQQDILSSSEYWSAQETLVMLQNGQMDNPNTEPASVFIPAGVPLTDKLMSDLNLAIYLNLLDPSKILPNSNMVALYYINPAGATIYYPNIDLANIVPPDFDVTDQIFYKLGAPEYNPDRKNVWTAPYQDPAGTGLIVTNISPIYDQNSKFRGVIAADVQLTKISDRISQIQIAQTGYAFLIDSAGHIIAMPPKGYEDFGLTQEIVPANETPKQSILNYGSQQLQSVFHQMTQGKSSLARVEIQGNDYYFAFAPLPITGYSLGLVVPVAELNEPVIQANASLAEENQTTIRFGILLLVSVLMGAILLGIGFSRFLTSPLEKLTRAAQQISAGNLDQTVAITSRDEVGLLGDTFNDMTTQLRDLFATMEKRVEERTHDLELASEVGRTISEKVTNMYEMLTEAVEMIRARFDLYYTQVYLVDSSGKTINLRAGTGDVGRELLQRGHHLMIGTSSLNGRAATEKRAMIVVDTKESPSFLPNPLLPNTRSEMALPLIVSGKVVGVLDMQSEQAGALNETNLPAFEALAGQLAIAIQNAALFTETEEARAEVEAQVKRTSEKGWQGFLDAINRGQKLGFTFDRGKINPLRSDALAPLATESALTIPVNVKGTKIGIIQLANEPDRELTANEKGLLQAVATQLAQHIDNLRLLAQAEQYRTEAEQAARRLTREGWDALRMRGEMAPGYVYDLNEVKLLSSNGNGNSSGTFKQALVVRDEIIGELAVDAITESNEASEILSAVARQLSDHIENLRLLETTEFELAERTRAEQDLLKMRLGMDRATDAVFITDTNGTIMYCNPAFEKVYGWKPEEAIGQNPRILKSGLIPPEQYKAFWDALTSKQVVAGEIINKTRDGRLIPIEASNNPILDADGNIIGFLGLHRDISERKQAEAIITKRATELQTVAQLSATTSTVLDPDKLLQSVVDLTKERFGLYHVHVYLADEAWKTLLLAAGAGEVGRKMVLEEHTIPTDAEKSLVARAARERTAIMVNDVRSDPGFLPNPLLPGTQSEMAVPMIVGNKVLGVFDVQSETAGYFTGEDANIYNTLAAQVAVALQNARLYVEQSATVTQLRELDRIKSSFLANMSHELRTPLNSILGFSDVMLEELDGPLTDNMNNDLTLIQKNGQHLLHLINDVLDMAKIEAGRMNLEIEKFNLHEIIEEVTSITSLHTSEKDLALCIEPDSDRDVEITADRTRLRQVMINLINNAMKFTEKGNVAIRVLHEDSHVLISVKDTGIGIPPSHLETVFQEFTQVDITATRKVGGTGLGLPISRRLIEMHGGRLWAESTGIPGEGSTFFVFLPIEAQVKEPEPETAK